MNKMRLKDICLITSSKRIFEKEYVSEGIPFIRGQEITDRSLLKSNIKFECYISKKRFEEIKEKYIIPKKHDILITAVGTIGNVCYLDKDVEFYFKDGNILHLTNFNEKIYPLYLYYYMKSDFFHKQINVSMIGAVQKALTIKMLSDILIEIPSLNEQKKIATILSVIDKKIELNNKINDELEAMAKTIYDYWFLQFEFPNEEGKPYKSSGGKMVWNEELKREIPEGWEVKHIIDILDNVPNSTKINTKEYLNRGKYPIIDQSSKYICGYTNDDNAVLSLKDAIIFGDHTKCIKYINFEFARGADGTQVILSKERNLSNLLLYYQIKDMHLVNQGYSRYFKFLKEQKIIIPDKYTKELFDNIEVLYKKIRKNLFENQELISLRDFLLPLLMNGQVGFKEDKAEG